MRGGGGKMMRGKVCERAEFSLISHEMFRRRALLALSRQPGMVRKTAGLARKPLFIILDLLFNTIDETYTVTGMKMVGDKGESV